MYVKLQAFNSNRHIWEDLPAKYPINFTKALDMSFDNGSFCTISAEYPSAYTRIKLFIGDNQNEVDKFYFYATASEQWRPNGKCQCEWRLIEPSKELQGYFVDGLSFTKNEGNEKSLFAVINRVLNVTPLRKKNQMQKFFLTSDNSVTNVLQQTKSPQYTWGSQTSLWEVLCDIGSYIDAIPRLTCNESTDEFNLITFDFINNFGANTEIPYYSRLINIDEEQYCSQLETNVQNLVVADEEEGSIVFPAPNAFATPRTEEVKLEGNNCQLILDKDIAEIEKFYLDASQITIKMQPKKKEAGTLNIVNDGNCVFMNLSEVLTLKNNFTGLLDATKRLFDSETWQALPLAENKSDMGLFKETTTYYTRYTNTIELINDRYKGVYDVFTVGKWKMVVNGAIYDMLKDHIYTGTVSYNDFDKYKFEKIEDGTTKNYFIEQKDGILYSTMEGDLRNIKFRVVYKPVDKHIKLRIGKHIKPDFQFIQPYNQRAEINVSKSYGRNMQGVANRMGTENMTVTEIASRWKDVKNVGDVFVYNYERYIITTVDVTILSNDVIRAVYYLSKNWNMLSQYFSIDKKFTNWTIPVENILRNLFYKDICMVSAVRPAKLVNESSLTANGIKTFMGVLCEAVENYTEVNNMQIDTYKYQKSDDKYLRQNITTAASFGFGNSIVFTASMKSNVAAGFMKKEKKEAKDNEVNYECQDSFYTLLDGTVDFADICFGGAVEHLDTLLWPQSKNIFNIQDNVWKKSNIIIEDCTYVKLQELEVDKDPAEILSMTYQLSIETEDENIIVGNAFACNNPLCKQGSSGNKFKIWQLTKRLPPMSVTVDTFGFVLQNASFSVNVYDAYAILSVNGCGKNGWAITDESDNLLIACNNGSFNTLYFTFSTENKQKTNIQPVAITYVYQSQSTGKILLEKVVQIAYGEQFELILEDDALKHYKINCVYVDGVLQDSMVFRATKDMTIKIVLQFVPYTKEIDVYTVLKDGYNYIEDLKAGATETIIQFTPDSGQALAHSKWLLTLTPTVTYQDRYFAAVVYYRKMYNANSEKKAVFGLAEINDKWSILKSVGKYSGSGGFVSKNLFGTQDITVKYDVTVDDGVLKIDIIDANVIYDINGGLGEPDTWVFSQALLKVEKIIQIFNEERQI